MQKGIDKRGKAAPCAGCLDAAAVDGAEEYLIRARREHLDVRAELLADIPRSRECRRSPLPDGLRDAPACNPLGLKLLNPYGLDLDATWVVWYRIGWLDPEVLERYIRRGRLPTTARARSPLKLEDYLYVDARAGAVIHDPTWFVREAADAAAERMALARTGAQAAGALTGSRE